jgi:hypothetical protein
MKAYRIQTLDGRFDHVQGLQRAVVRACELVGVEPRKVGMRELGVRYLAAHHGVTITLISADQARSAGLS